MNCLIWSICSPQDDVSYFGFGLHDDRTGSLNGLLSLWSRHAIESAIANREVFGFDRSTGALVPPAAPVADLSA